MHTDDPWVEEAIIAGGLHVTRGRRMTVRARLDAFVRKLRRLERVAYLVVGRGLTIRAAAHELHLPRSTVADWLREARKMGL